MQRFLSMRATFWDQFKPAPKNFLFAFSWTVLPIGICTYILYTYKVSFEHLHVMIYCWYSLVFIASRFTINYHEFNQQCIICQSAQLNSVIVAECQSVEVPVKPKIISHTL